MLSSSTAAAAHRESSKVREVTAATLAPFNPASSKSSPTTGPEDAKEQHRYNFTYEDNPLF